MTDRREVLRWLATGAALPFLGRLAPDEILAFGRRVHGLNEAHLGASGWQALDAQAGRTLVAACERILPASDTPGATAAGVDRFIDRVLADWLSVPERDSFVAGLRTLDARSRDQHGREFVECSAEEQAMLLSTLDDEAASATKEDPHWFALLKELTIWGYFTSEVVATTVLHQSPLGAGRYEGCAPVVANQGRSSS